MLRSVKYLLTFIVCGNVSSSTGVNTDLSKEYVKQLKLVKDTFKKAKVLENDKEFIKKVDLEKDKFKDAKFENYEFPDIPEVDVPNIDFDAIAKKADEIKYSVNSAPSLYAFISLGLPERTIINILKEAKLLKAKVYLRGVKKDLKTTIKTIRDLSKKSGGTILIDPTVFLKFNVDRVPAYILSTKELDASKYQSNEIPPFIKAYGDVTIQYFIDYIKRNGTDSEIALANALKGSKS